ncbi:hypothetical protein LguiA_016503 [Lonicera macranthoides]
MIKKWHVLEGLFDFFGPIRVTRTDLNQSVSIFDFGFGAKEGDSVLDLCYGSGNLAFLLSEKVGSCGKVLVMECLLNIFVIDSFATLSAWLIGSVGRLSHESDAK